MNTAIQHYDGTMGAAITQFRDPEEVLAEAQRAATALKKVVSMKEKPVMFNGEQYLEREDWGTVARFYGCTAKPTETRFVQFGEVCGFEAVAVVIDLRTGIEVGRAESMCLNDEENWGDIPKYEWQDELDEHGKKIWIEKDGKRRPKAKKVQVGFTKKPLFQLRSMAQTRAEAKALKGLFSWVVVLAGYKPTPAEEMTGHEFDGRENDYSKKPPVENPQEKVETHKDGQPFELSGVIEQAKQTQNTLWLTVKGIDPGLVSVALDKVDGDMKPDYRISFTANPLRNDRVGSYWGFVSLRGLEAPEAAQQAPAAEQGQKLAPDAQAVAEEMFPQAGGKEAVQGMVDSGKLKPASQIEKKTIGTKRAQRLYTMANQNKDRNNGLNEAKIKEILAVLPTPLEHLSDLEVGMYEKFEAWAEGREDWKAWLESD